MAKLTSKLGLDRKMAVLAALGRHSVFGGYKQLHTRPFGCIRDGPLCGERTICECGDDDLHAVLQKDGRYRLNVRIVHRGDFGALEKGVLDRVTPRAGKRYDRSAAVYQRLS